MLKQQNQLEQICKDMPVHDNTGKKIGTVTFVHTGPNDYEADWNSSPLDDVPAPIINELSNNYPEEVNERLLQAGFLLGTRYVLPQYISEVRSGAVHLSIEEDLILKF